MLDMKQAYSILGLEENALLEEVEKRYTVLLMRNKNRSDETALAAGEPTMAQVTEAYNFIKGAAIQEEIKQKEPKNATIGRIGHIYEYYRWHIIGTILVIVLIFYTGSSILENRNEEKRIARADLKVTFFTDFQVQDPQPFEVKLLEGLKDWKDIHLVNQYAPTNPKDEYGMAMLQKAMISMAADKADLYIIDKANFDKFGAQGAFLNLQEIPALSGTPKDKRVMAKVEEGSTLWTGLDVTDHPVLKNMNLPAGQKIAAIRVNADKKENAAKALEWLAAP
jgi:hypothetical protein